MARTMMAHAKAPPATRLSDQLQAAKLGRKVCRYAAGSKVDPVHSVHEAQRGFTGPVEQGHMIRQALMHHLLRCFERNCDDAQAVDIELRVFGLAHVIVHGISIHFSSFFKTLLIPFIRLNAWQTHKKSVPKPSSHCPAAMGPE